jgi:hypothetical protein
MARIKIGNIQFNRFAREIQSHVRSIFSRAIDESRDLVFRESEMLAEAILQSEEFNSLQGRLAGEFGFTPEEITDLPRIGQLLIPGTDRNITNIEIKNNTQRNSIVLNWVNFDNLKKHPLSQHDLTRFNRSSGSFEVQQTISWVEWLEEGVTVRGYVFDPGRTNSPPSRSAAGLMVQRSGGIWVYRPTQLFRDLGRKFDDQRLRRGFGVIIRRIANR